MKAGSAASRDPVVESVGVAIEGGSLGLNPFDNGCGMEFRGSDETEEAVKMANMPARRQPLLPDLSDWFEMLTPTPWRSMPGLHGIRIEETEEEGKYVIKAEIPGIDPDKDLELTVGDGLLNVRAERSERTTEKHHSEFRYGSFSRTVRLPRGTDESKITANYTAGILTITVPIDEEKKPAQKIAVTRE
jgi:HSP20 family molecular chaperone IbpA